MMLCPLRLPSTLATKLCADPVLLSGPLDTPSALAHAIWHRAEPVERQDDGDDAAVEEAKGDLVSAVFSRSRSSCKRRRGG